MNYITRLRNAFETLKQVKKETGGSYCEIVKDFLPLRKSLGISLPEYRDYDFYNQTDLFRQTFLGEKDKDKFLQILNPRKYYILARNKYLAHLLLDSVDIPKAELYFYYNPESRYSNEFIASDYKSALSIFIKKNIKQVVAKTTESSYGEGVVVYKDVFFNDGNSCILTRFDGTEESLESILKSEPLIFETPIQQTKQFNNFNESSVNTIRFMTILFPDGHAELINTFIKIGRKNACVDNAGKGGNVDGAVDIESGYLKHIVQFEGYGKLTKITHHPDTQTLLEGVQIENWTEIKSKVIQFQERISFIKAIGWDVAITDKGPTIIEINDYWDQTGQLFLRKGWRNEILKCYNAWVDYYSQNGHKT